MIRVLAILLSLMSFAACAPRPAQAPPPGEPVACRAVDGDTIDCAGQRVRLVNVDTPELRGACAAESALARRARAFVAERLAAGPVEIVPDPRRPRDRYGRTLARVAVGGADLGEALIAAGLARRWDGRRRPWCP
jgi:endonuclease YncB( thermonuclease family)